MSSNDNNEPILIEEGVEQESNKWHTSLGSKNLLRDKIRNVLNFDSCLTETYVFSTKPLKLTLNEIHSPFTYHPAVIHGNTILYILELNAYHEDAQELTSSLIASFVEGRYTIV